MNVNEIFFAELAGRLIHAKPADLCHFAGRLKDEAKGRHDQWETMVRLHASFLEEHYNNFDRPRFLRIVLEE